MFHATILEPLEADQWFVDSIDLREFVATARDIRARTKHNPALTLTELEPHFKTLLTKQNWLPENFAQPNPNSAMGGGIGQWLLYRAQDRSLTIFSLVIPPGSTTPVHDHLAWGLIGLYKGQLEETRYQRVDNGYTQESAVLELIEVQQQKRGDIYHLLPPDGDIHAVKATTIFAPSVSIHVMGNDIGSILRNQYDPEQKSVRSFRSGYSNISPKG
ncbi:cysteine dioxygenase family protein [Brasilonema sp. CT11]|nr:cysteine dioxygenase family protein [Brasilonema sp. CT11]